MQFCSNLCVFHTWSFTPFGDTRSDSHMEFHTILEKQNQTVVKFHVWCENPCGINVFHTRNVVPRVINNFEWFLWCELQENLVIVVINTQRTVWTILDLIKSGVKLNINIFIHCNWVFPREKKSCKLVSYRTVSFYLRRKKRRRIRASCRAAISGEF